MRRPDLRHPFTQAIIVLLIAYVLIDFGIPYIPPLLGIESAPVPDSVLLQFMLTVLVGVLIYVSDNEQRWRRFKQPITATMVQPERKPLRIVLLVLIPLAVGAFTYSQVRPSVSAPPALRSIHPAPPGQITFRGKTMVLANLENPLRRDGSIAEDYQLGLEVYYKNCMPCHGDALAGDGHFAHGYNPAPLDFTDNGTIPQLTESFVFWRIAKGGPGLPNEGAPWHSAMPAWEEFLTEDEIWSVIIFLYEQTGWQPRSWHAGEATGGTGEEGGDD